MSSKKPDGFQVKCGFDRVRAVLGMDSKEKFEANRVYTCIRGEAEFVWNGGASLYVVPLHDWPDQDPFWEMMRLLNDPNVTEEKLHTWALMSQR